MTFQAPENAAALREELERRGIIDAAYDAGWIPQAYSANGTTFMDGWSYPTHYDIDQGVIRWKAGDSSAKMKYSWPEGKPEHVKYYLLNEINTDDHTLYVAAGEPDLLVLHILIPTRNKLCWFGEQSIPSTFVQDCVAWGITDVVYYMDHDDAGTKAAYNLVLMVEEAKIKDPSITLNVHPKWIWDRVTDKNGLDLNKLWMECGFDDKAMRKALSGMKTDRSTIEHAQRQAAARVKNQQEMEVRKLEREDDYIGAKYGTSHPDEVAEIKRRCVIEVAKHLKKKGDKPDYYVCPFPHDPKDPEKDFILHLPDGPGDDAYIAGCCGKHAGAYKNHATKWAKHFNIDVTQIARDVAREYRPDSVSDKSEPESEYMKGKYEPEGEVQFVDSTTALTSLDNWMEGEDLPDELAILCPYEPLRGLGGFARLWKSGKAILIIGTAGSGKTALLGRMSNNLRIDGYDDYMVGSEWTEEDYQMRAVTRYSEGAISYTKQWEHIEYMRQKAKGVENPDFIPMHRNLLDDAAVIRQQIASWPGKTYYPLNESMNNIERVMDGIGKHALKMRELGRRPAVVWWDYLQMGRGGDDGWYQLEYDMGIAKEICAFYKLIPVFVSQVSKSVEKMVESGGGIVNGADGQGIGRAKPNLIVTISPVMKGGFRYEYAILKVSKNNGGMAPAQVTVHTKLSAHDWTDNIASDEEIKRLLGDDA